MRNKADSLASKTRNIIICAFISIALFGVGLVVGYINGETAAKRHRSTALNDNSAGSCSDPKWSEKETRLDWVNCVMVEYKMVNYIGKIVFNIMRFSIKFEQ